MSVQARYRTFHADTDPVERDTVEIELEADWPTVPGRGFAHRNGFTLGHEGIIINGQPIRQTHKADRIFTAIDRCPNSLRVYEKV